VRVDRPRFNASDESRTKLAEAFAAAINEGDFDTIAQLLADDAVLLQDGGGKRVAARDPIRGKDKIVRFFSAVKKGATAQIEAVERVDINGLPGFVIRTTAGVETMSFDVANDHIIAIYSVRNPDKLRHLS
jgi:RNA polymerase sigma-70 factor (ECF subfamily)